MPPDHLRVRDLPAAERPRERLAREGADALGNDELIAILLRTGSRRDSALSLAQRLLAEFGTLHALSAASVEQLSAVPGIGLAKAAQLHAAFTVGRRAQQETHDRPTIRDPKDAARLVRSRLASTTEEHFWLLCLDTRHRVIRAEEISKGTLDASLAAPREIFRAALMHNSAAVIVAHNHPSGDPEPSPDDLETTTRLHKAGALLGITLVDHLILGVGDSFVSLPARGVLD